MNRRQLMAHSLAAGGAAALHPLVHATGPTERVQADDSPILVAIELSGGNDGLNSIVPFADDAYYRARPTIGIKRADLLPLDDHFGFNSGMLGLQRLWNDNQLAIVHGCGYAQPSYSHFTSMAYWHTGAPHSGSRLGWMGRVADALAPRYQDNMLINVASTQSLAVVSGVHTPVVFDDPDRFQRHRWMRGASAGSNASVADNSKREQAVAKPNDVASQKTHGKESDKTSVSTRDFLRRVDRSASASANLIRQATTTYKTPVDYGIAPIDLPKVAACIASGLPTQLYYVAFRNNAFDTHVQQPALHQRLLSYACDGIHGFIRDLERINQAHRVVVLVFSEFGRRVPENANLGTDHGSANVMFVAGAPVTGGHYGQVPSLTALVDGDNLQFTTDFRRVYASVMEQWLGVDPQAVLGQKFESFNFFT